MSPLSPGLVAADLIAVWQFCTRVPLPFATRPGADLGRASWAFPIVGALVGVVGAAVYALARAVGLPPLPTAGAAVAVMAAFTGCLHEDGLSDYADSFGGSTRERRLAIMRDSRIGNYGAVAIVLSLVLRISALAAIADVVLAALAVLAAHVAARGVLPLFMMLVPRARPDGLSATLGRPPRESAAIAVGIAALALLLALGIGAGFVALVLLAAVFAAMALMAVDRLGGQTGDVVGALEQLSEITVLLVAAAQFG